MTKDALCDHQKVFKVDNTPTYSIQCETCLGGNLHFGGNSTCHADPAYPNCLKTYVSDETPTFVCYLCGAAKVFFTDDCYPLPTECLIGTMTE